VEKINADGVGKIMVEVETKDVGEVRDVYRGKCEIKKTTEDLYEKYIKINMGLEERD